MNYDPKSKSDDNDGGQQQFDPNEIIQSSPNQIQQNSIDDYHPLGDYKPDIINKSDDWGGTSKQSESTSSLDD
jgi:hypothetical protein